MLPLIKDALVGQGYAFLEEFRGEAQTAIVAQELGRPLSTWKGRLVQELTPRVIAPPNTYSGIYGLRSFPFHTDLAHWRMPPRYVLLRCVTGFAAVPTQLIDGRIIVKSVKRDLLTRAIFKPRRPRQGALSLLRLLEQSKGSYRLRWDVVFLKSASRVGDIAVASVQEQLAQCKPSSTALVRSGDTILVDNWRMLHSRAPIPPECMERRIERVYLEDLH